MSYIQKSVFYLFILMLFTTPFMSTAQSGLVPGCSNYTYTKNVLDKSTNPPTVKTETITECTWGFKEIMTLINTVINFILFKMVVPISAIMFCYAGFLLLTSGGGEQKTKAKHIFSNVVIGLIIAAASWLIIKLLLSVLGYDGAWIGF
ncbi:MAG: hypothetical protein QG644_131 [Patescibacteria group bacterium]|nr:hypothetical protein [Patescibacteria group bacterium]